MRIALFSEVFLPKIDGITNRLRHTLECLREDGHEVLVFAPDAAVPAHAGAQVVRVPALPFPPYPELRAALPDPRIAWELARFRPDVVHAVGPACLGIWGIAAARALRLPIVASYHTDLPGYLSLHGLGWARPAAWPLLRAVHNAATLNLTPSRPTRQELLRQGIWNVGLWRGGVDTDLFHPARRSLAMRARLSDGRLDAPLLLYAGRLSPEKNLASLAWALDAIPRARLALVGDGPARPALERVFAGTQTVFAGFLRGEELAAAFASADVFVMPSRTETLGFVVLEAMSAGTPVVAARAGGIPDLVTHEEDGLLYDPDRREELVEALGGLLEQRGRRAFLARNARKRAEQCTWVAETRRLLRHYAKAIRLHRRSSLAARLLWPPPASEAED
jgi:glycosyltransferase involved in cell wall biosynthesis